MSAAQRNRGWIISVLALLAGVGAAALVARLWPVAPWSLQIPTWLASRLSEAGTDTVTLGRPATLWLLPIAALPFVIVALGRSLVDAPRWQLAFQLLSRVAALLAVALALAMPSLESPIRGKTVVFVIDTSASIDEGQITEARKLLQTALDQRTTEADADLDRADRTRVALVTYAARADVIELPDDADPKTVVALADGDAALGSDHAGALRLAAALVDPQTEGRVVLISDAAGSAMEREDLANAARELVAAGITVHTRSFAPAARDDVAVEAVHLPKELRVGQTFDVVVDLWSTAPHELKLHLDVDGAPNTLQPEIEVKLVAGRTQVKLPSRPTKPGPVVYTARLETTTLDPADNRLAGNDQVAVAGDVQGRPRVLLASSDGGGPLASALRADHLDVETVGPGSVPQTADALRPYDLVVFSDISARSVPAASARAVDEYVERHGGGFVMVGGENSYGTGGWGGSVIERTLPVRFEGERQREQAKLALVLVIDKSGSMSSEDRLDLVKEAARVTAQTLEPTDQLGVIAFDSRPHVLVRLQASKNRMRIASDIRRLASGGGTNALPALREAYLQLAGSNALVKHVILLSDGQSPEQGIDSLLGDMRDGDITVSAVGVGAGAGKDFLRRVASRGRGRFYFSQDGTDVPRIFSRDTNEATRNAIDERLHYAKVSKSVQALRGIDFTRAPGLRGIVPVKAKPLAEVLLRTQDGEPLLVRGRRGLGQTVAFASDAKARWAASWLGWSGFGKLWGQVARDAMRQGATMLGGASIKLVAGDDPSSWNVVVDVDSPEGFANELDASLEVIDPALAADDPARTMTLVLELSAPGRYEGVLHDVSRGQRVLRAKLHDRELPPRLVAEATAQVSVPYPGELRPDQFEWNPQWLEALPVASHDGAVDEVVAAPGDPGSRLRVESLWPRVLLFLLLPLLLLDLLLRRISLGVRRVAT